MFHVVLVSPEIPANSGNVIRLSANIGFTLHLVEPLGFALTDKHLRRAGLDYHEYANLKVHPDLPTALQQCGNGRRFVLTGQGGVCYNSVKFSAGDVFLFGCESVGLPANVIESVQPDKRLFIPMLPHSRSFNLSNTVAIMAMEAWQQLGFSGVASDIK